MINKKVKILESLIKRIVIEERQKLLTEKFMSPKLAQFASELIKFKKEYGSNSGKLLSGVAWDKVPDSEVILKKSGDEDLKRYVNSDEYIIIWFAPEQQTVQWKPTTYTKYGSKQDNSTYLRAGQVIITQGREFLYGYKTLQNYRPAKDRYEKPADAKLSVLKLYTEMGANALILKKDVLQKYSTTDLMKQRSDSKSGATALMKVSDILSKNQDRYRELLRQSKLNNKTKSTADAVKSGLDKLRAKIEQLSKIDFNDLVSYSPNDSYYDKSTPVPSIKNIDLSKLNAAANLYKQIVNAMGEYLNDSKNGYSGADRAKDRALELLTKIDTL